MGHYLYAVDEPFIGFRRERLPVCRSLRADLYAGCKRGDPVDSGSEWEHTNGWRGRDQQHKRAERAVRAGCVGADYADHRLDRSSIQVRLRSRRESEHRYAASITLPVTYSYDRKPRLCGEDLWLDVDIRFARNMSEIDRVYGEGLRKVARDIRKALSDVPTNRRRCIELTVEGHTDQTVPYVVMTDRDRTLFNWRLSSDRANSVLYLFHEEGVRPPEYRILALGYADSERLEQSCGPRDDACNAKNRRTTFRIRVDTVNLEHQLSIDAGSGTTQGGVMEK